MLAIEFSLDKPDPACALHRLFTLSERFSIALCTKPPSPFVGDGGRSIRSGDIRPWEGDIANARLLGCRSPPCDDVESDDGGSNLWLCRVGNGERNPLADESDAEVECLRSKLDLLRVDPSSEGEIERNPSAGGLVSFGSSALGPRERPCKRTFSVEAVVSDRSSFCCFRYAADRSPRSRVCLNHDGSLVPNDRAISSRDTDFSAGAGVSTPPGGAIVPLSLGENIDSGRGRAPGEPLDNGRCCQDSVPARDRVAAGFDVTSEDPTVSGNGRGESRGILAVPPKSNFRGPSGLFKGLSILESRVTADCCKWLGDLLKSSCLGRLIGERIEVGVPAFEDDLVGESDLARSIPSISPRHFIALPRLIGR